MIKISTKEWLFLFISLFVAGAGLFQTLCPRIRYALIFIGLSGILFILGRNIFKGKSWPFIKNFVFSSPVRRKTDNEIAEEAFNEDDDE